MRVRAIKSIHIRYRILQHEFMRFLITKYRSNEIDSVFRAGRRKTSVADDKTIMKYNACWPARAAGEGGEVRCTDRCGEAGDPRRKNVGRVWSIWNALRLPRRPENQFSVDFPFGDQKRFTASGIFPDISCSIYAYYVLDRIAVVIVHGGRRLQ